MMRRLLFLLVLLTLNACGTTVSDARRNRILDQEIPALTPTRTWCIGRFLFDLPPSAHLYNGEYGGRYKYWYAKVVMPPQKMSLAQFANTIKARENALRAVKHDKETSLLRKSVHVDQSTVVMASWEKDFSWAVTDIEGYRWVDGWTFQLKAKVDRAKQEVGIERMQERLGRLRYRSRDEIPNTIGYCFPGGFIADEKIHSEESVMSFEFPGYPDLTLSLDIYPTRAVPKPLLSRTGGVMQALGGMAARVRTLRSGDRPLAGFPGQEILMSLPHEASGGRSHVFIWEYPGRGTLQGPFIKFELVTGSEKKPVSLTNEQAIALWDAILNSFRIRPTSGAAKHGSAPRPEPLKTGDACTRTGHWRCVEDGGTFHFVSGQTMPATIAHEPAQGWFARLRGQTGIHQVSGHWEWAEPDEAESKNLPPS